MQADKSSTIEAEPVNPVCTSCPSVMSLGVTVGPRLLAGPASGNLYCTHYFYKTCTLVVSKLELSGHLHSAGLAAARPQPSRHGATCHWKIRSADSMHCFVRLAHGSIASVEYTTTLGI